MLPNVAQFCSLKRRRRDQSVPGRSYADRFLNELNSHGKLFDLIIGDSQWIGGAAENKWYVKLNDFFAKEHITAARQSTVLRDYAHKRPNRPNTK